MKAAGYTVSACPRQLWIRVRRSVSKHEPVANFWLCGIEDVGDESVEQGGPLARERS